MEWHSVLVDLLLGSADGVPLHPTV